MYNVNFKKINERFGFSFKAISYGSAAKGTPKYGPN